ncbi:alpha/beta fold hydrolase [Acidiphilium multivorum]|nr:alpha/beta fold hydrolase [Acidiphilium multivorum]
MTRPDAPGPMERRGPRPLLLHLMLAAMRSNASIAALPNLRHVWPHWNATDSLADPDFAAAVVREALAQDAALLAGIAAYRRHPWRRTLADPPAVWAEGSSRLLDYGGTGPVLFFVPSLVNRAHILDLAEDASFLRFLAAQGAHPLLLDWGWPGAIERQFTLTDYVAGRLERALEAVAGPVVLVGYCMGGLLALAAALRAPERIRALALLATPWDFHAEDEEAARSLATSLPILEPLMAATGTVPIDALQTLFATLDPFGVTAKYRAFAALDPASPRAVRFVALEDWLNDGVPLAAPVARETLGGWYGENATAQGAWRIAGLPVNPAAITCPTLIATPARDRLVPPASAAALATVVPHATVIAPKAGHIGMIAGMSAPQALWQPFGEWVAGL